MNRLSLLWCALAVAVMIGAFQIKYQVQALVEDTAAIRTNIAATRTDVRVLEAEWAYLNSPDRLADLASRHLGLAPLKPQQVVGAARVSHVAGLPAAKDETAAGRAPYATPINAGGAQ